MMIVGIIVLVGALAAIGVGIYQWRKMKLVGDAPLVKTGEIVRGANEKGLVSVEGRIETPEPLISPCSGTPCLYYEVTVTQKYEERVSTENGVKTKKGSSQVKKDQVGARFYINDGSGPAKIDASEGKIQAKLEKTYKQDGPASGFCTFGQYQINVPSRSGKGYATSTECVEKIVPVAAEAYAAGQLQGDTMVRKQSMGGRLIIATEGLEALQKSTKRKAIASAAAAALMVPGGGVMTALGEMPQGSGCDSLVGDIESACTGRQSDSDPVEFTWTVEQPGTYALSAIGTGTDRNYRLWPHVTVRNATGAQVFEMSGTGGDAAQAQGVFAPGVYTVSVTDTAEMWASGLEGGAGFSFDIDAVSLAAGAMPAVAAPAAAGGANVGLLFAGDCQPNFAGNTTVTAANGQITVSTTGAAGLTGMFGLSIPAEAVQAGELTLSTQGRVDAPGTIVQVMAGQVWTNMGKDSANILSRGAEDPIAGRVVIRSFDGATGVSDVTLENVVLQNPQSGSLCTVSGTLQTTGS